jgi:hypothetical protein
MDTRTGMGTRLASHRARQAFIIVSPARRWEIEQWPRLAS